MKQKIAHLINSTPLLKLPAVCILAILWVFGFYWCTYCGKFHHQYNEEPYNSYGEFRLTDICCEKGIRTGGER